MALNLFLWAGCCGGRAGSHVCDNYVHQDRKVWCSFLPSGLRGGVWQRQGTLWTHQQSLFSSRWKEVGIKSLVSVCLQSWRCDPSFVYISLKCRKEVRATGIVVNKFTSSNMLCISNEYGLRKCCTKVLHKRGKYFIWNILLTMKIRILFHDRITVEWPLKGLALRATFSWNFSIIFFTCKWTFHLVSPFYLRSLVECIGWTS